MRVLIVATAICLSIVGLAAAQDARAAMKMPTNIPAQGLGPALKALAQARDLQVLYFSQTVRDMRTAGASGELTTDEALTQLLTGTGLIYRYVDDKAVTILPAGATNGAMPATSNDPNGPSSSAKEGKKSSSQEFRVAQTNQGGVASPTSVTGDGQDSDATTPALTEIVVTGRYEFLSVDTSGTTNLPLPIEKVPQSISLVSNDFIKAADLKTLAEIAEYTPGATNAGNQYGLASDVKLRGFTPGRAVDGINVVPQAFYEPDYAIFDRLEVVKGPSSVIYGIASPGGLVNFVTKSATPQTVDYVYAQAGSWNSYRLEAQVTGALDADGHVRAIGIGVLDRGDSFLDQLYHHKGVLYGGLDFNLSDSVTAYLHGGYERVVRPAFDGIPAKLDGSPAPLPTSFFIGSRGIVYTTSVYHAEGDLTWHANEDLEFSVKSNFENSSTSGDQDFSYSLSDNGDIGLEAARLDEWRMRSYGLGVSAIYRFDSLGLKNSFVSLGALYQNSDNTQVDEFAFGGGNVFSGEASLTQALSALLAGPLTPPSGIDTKTRATTVSLQSGLQLADPLSLLVGASYSKPDVTVTAINPAVSGVAGSSINAGKASFRSGLTYEFLPKTNAYLSFSQSFYPQGLTAVGNAPLPNLTGNQYEAGIKYRSADGRLLLTGALFQIDERNLGEFDTIVNGLTYWKAIGEVKNRGAELQALGQITPDWQVNAGFAYLDPKVTEDSDPTAVGQTELFLPKETASVFSTYTLHEGVLHGLSVGGGARFVGAQRTSYDGSSKDFPSYALIDATVGYTLDKLLLQFSAHNLFDKHYLISNYQTLFDGNTVGTPTNVSLSVRRQF